MRAWDVCNCATITFGPYVHLIPFIQMVFSSLHKKVTDRATYPVLLEHTFLECHKNKDIAQFVSSVLE